MIDAGVTFLKGDVYIISKYLINFKILIFTIII